MTLRIPSARAASRARSTADAETSTPSALPARAARAASRVVCPLPHPMSRTWSRNWTPQAWRSTSLCRCSSGSYDITAQRLLVGLPDAGSLGGHRFDDPLQVVDGGELDHDLALVAAEFDLDPRLEYIGQPVREVTEGRGYWLSGGGPAVRLGRGVVANGDDLLDGADRESFRHNALRQSLLCLRVVQREQRAGVAGADDTGGDPLLHGGWQVQQPERVADVRPGPADLLRQLLVGRAEVVQQLLVRRGLLQGVELLTVQVLHQRVPQHVVVMSRANDGGNEVQAGSLGPTPGPFAHDQLVAGTTEAAHHHRLEESDLGDRSGQLVECVVIESPPRLPRIRRDGVDRDFLKVRPSAWAQRGLGRTLT